MMSILPLQPAGAPSPKSGIGSLVLTAVSGEVEVEEASLEVDDDVELKVVAVVVDDVDDDDDAE